MFLERHMTARHWSHRFFLALAATFVLASVSSQTSTLTAQKLDPLIYTISFPQPASKTFDVKVEVPTGKRASVDLMMAIWSPGFYGIQNYADRVTAFSATAPDGVALKVTKPKPSRWTIKTGGKPTITVTYTLSAPR